LRTPIARLGFGLELLREESHGDLPEARIAAMEADIAELNALVNELLNLTKLDQQQSLKMVSVDVASMLAELRSAVAHSVHDKQLRIVCVEDIGTIEADVRMLTRALGNLVQNAIKYGNHQILVSATTMADGSIQFSVEDDGPGIPPDQRERVFEAFYRLDQSRDRSTGGFGLGLAIAQKAVQLHGATIHITDSSLGGAKCWFVIRQNR
jgi:two-component system OmpR family sensor kinase